MNEGTTHRDRSHGSMDLEGKEVTGILLQAGERVRAEMELGMRDMPFSPWISSSCKRSDFEKTPERQSRWWADGRLTPRRGRRRRGGSGPAASAPSALFASREKSG